MDLWSAGTIIYQMVTRDPPFNGANHIQLLKNIESTKRLRFPPKLSDDCKDLVVRLLKRNPLQRISWEDLFNHPWLHPTQPLTVSTSPSSGGGSGGRLSKSGSVRTATTSPKMVQLHRSRTHSRSDSDRTDRSGRKHRFPPPLQINKNSPEAFILIDSGPNSAASSRPISSGIHSNGTPPAQPSVTPVAVTPMNSKLYLEFVGQCNKTLKSVSRQYAFAQCLMKVGDVETSREHISSALLLYLRGLDVLESVIVTVQQWIASYGMSHKYFHRTFKRKRNANQLLNGMTQSKVDALSVQFKQLLLDSIRCYDDHWKRGEAIQTLCATECLQFEVENNGNIDGVLFRFAIDMAQKSCSDVLLHIDEREQQQSAQSKVKQSVLVLEYLMAVDSVSDEDKGEIRKCT